MTNFVLAPNRNCCSKSEGKLNKKLIILLCIFIFVSPLAAQEVTVNYLNPAFTTTDYDYLRFGNSSGYYVIQLEERDRQQEKDKEQMLKRILNLEKKVQ